MLDEPLEERNISKPSKLRNVLFLIVMVLLTALFLFLLYLALMNRIKE
jgi:hypothetical protein